MPKSIEIEATTLEEAMDMALKQLGVKKEQVNIRILSEEQKGLFGMQGAKPVKVRVTVKKETAK
jgi:spoIIIJ-associated protein